MRILKRIIKNKWMLKAMSTTSAPISNQRFIPHSESKAREWVAALPLADPGETTRRLFHGLVDMNRRALAPQTRLAISELLRAPLDVALENLHRHLSARAFPLTQKSQKIFELTQSLMLEFAGSYQVAALDMITKKEGNKKTLQTTLYRALDYMGRVLLLTYTVYIRTRETLWHDLHHLYLLAVENGIDQLKIKDPSLGAPTIEARYIQINVLALVKPYSLRQGEATRLMQYIANNTHLVSINREAEGQVGNYVHAMLLNSDESALIMPASDLPHSPTVRVLNLAPLLAALDEHISRLEDSGIPAMMLHDGLSRNLAKRCIFHLTQVRNRSYNRFPKNEKISMVTRMGDVLSAIQEVQKQDNGVQSHEEDLLFNVFNTVEDDYYDDKRKPVITEAEEKRGACIYTWLVMNSSVGGYGLCWPNREESGARVGEVVALRDVDHANTGNTSWMIGVIKWMEYVMGKGLCCGVELLSTKAMPLRVNKVNNRPLKQKLPIDGLVLPSIEGIRPDPALVLPAYIFQSGDDISLNFAEREERVRLLMLDECLGAFAYFRFDTVAPALMNEEEDDFNSLWQSL